MFIVLAVCVLFYKQKPADDRRISYWSSDVCSSELLYCASKAAWSGLSDTHALEVQPLGVQVTAVEVGGMRTDFAGRSLRMAADRLAVYVPMRGEVEAEIGRG